MTIRTYSELSTIGSFEDRYEYLRLRGQVGESTFGYDRWLNQQFYRGPQWRRLRSFIITRDNGCDLATPGMEIFGRIIIHHMNPITVDDIAGGNDEILEPEFLVSTSHDTHNAIHYGDVKLLRKPYVERSRGDTRLW